MRDYVTTHGDNGGVHINSGIPNRAFVLAAQALGGYAWERAGRIWYHALASPLLVSDADFAQFAQVTIEVAKDLFGAGSPEADAVRGGWNGVGIPI